MPASFSSRRGCGFGWKCNSCSRPGCKPVAEALDECAEGRPAFAPVCRLSFRLAGAPPWGGSASTQWGEEKPAAGESQCVHTPSEARGTNVLQNDFPLAKINFLRKSAVYWFIFRHHHHFGRQHKTLKVSRSPLLSFAWGPEVLLAGWKHGGKGPLSWSQVIVKGKALGSVRHWLRLPWGCCVGASGGCVSPAGPATEYQLLRVVWTD